MTSKSPARTALTIVAGAIVFFGGCHKQVAKSTPHPPAATPAAERPTVTLSASPADITKGGSATLTWSSTNASQLSLTPSVGNVSPQGSTKVSPSDSTTYTLTASSAAGNAEASARVTVSLPPTAAAAPPNLDELFGQDVKDAFFNYDRADIRSDAREVLTKDGEFLRSYSGVYVVIESHCDERGSEEYNLALGDRRATAAKNYLVSLGISANQIQTTSVGKERPFCTDQNEACWQQNRRAHFEMNR